MVDVKWHLKKYVFFIVLMVMVVITGNIVLGKRGSGKNTEEVWEAVGRTGTCECF